MLRLRAVVLRAVWLVVAAEGLTKSLELFSPAKINLFLRVMGKRDDGFHELASLFQAIDLGDTLTVSPSNGPADEFACNIPSLSGNDNLVTRAFAKFREKTGSSQRFEAFLEKNTPVEAGLGGGSSNAATALYAANTLCGNPASPEDLIEWSADLGSDITFFLGPTGSAYCTGRGEVIEPLDPLPNLRLYVVKPEMGLSTPLVFKTLAASGYSTLSERDPREDLLASFVHGAPGPEDYVNDLEPPAFDLEPSLAAIKAKLLDLSPAAMMSGSGTSLFAVLSPDQSPDPDFPAAFEQACRDDLGLNVQLFDVCFAKRDGHDSWYAPP